VKLGRRAFSFEKENSKSIAGASFCSEIKKSFQDSLQGTATASPQITGQKIHERKELQLSNEANFISPLHFFKYMKIIFLLFYLVNIWALKEKTILFQNDMFWEYICPYMALILLLNYLLILNARKTSFRWAFVVISLVELTGIYFFIIHPIFFLNFPSKNALLLRMVSSYILLCIMQSLSLFW